MVPAMSQLGHFRQIGTVLTLMGRPLCSESGHAGLASICPLSANSDLTHCSKYNRYLITSSPLFAERALRNIWPRSCGSLGFNVGGADHFAPLLGLICDELAEVGGRTDERRAAQICEPRLDRGIGEARIDFRI